MCVAGYIRPERKFGSLGTVEQTKTVNWWDLKLHTQLVLFLFLEPDPRKIANEGLVNGLGGSVHCTRYAGTDRLLISILMCIYWKCLYASGYVLLCFRKL